MGCAAKTAGRRCAEPPDQIFLASVSTSVAKYMVKRCRPPSQGWSTFLRNHAPDIAAMDLFVVPTIKGKLGVLRIPGIRLQVKRSIRVQ
jgi:hypothetical protein